MLSSSKAPISMQIFKNKSFFTVRQCATQNVRWMTSQAERKKDLSYCPGKSIKLHLKSLSTIEDFLCSFAFVSFFQISVCLSFFFFFPVFNKNKIFNLTFGSEICKNGKIQHLKHFRLINKIFFEKEEKVEKEERNKIKNVKIWSV